MPNNKNTINYWLNYLNGFPSGFNNRDLKQVKKVARHLNLLNPKPIVITVAGTNGKGSTVKFLEEILLAAGMRVAAFTSPHIFTYNERIRINGRKVSDKSLCQAFKVIDKAQRALRTSLSYFEFTTLTALYLYQQKPLEVIVLEVGIGGRFDATNIIDADIAIITSIALDHVKILGGTRSKIGFEKSGIMRQYGRVVCGANMPKIVVTRAKQLSATLYQLGIDFTLQKTVKCWQWQWQKASINKLPLPLLHIDNAAIALMAIKLLERDFALQISLTAIKKGIKQAFLYGRFQVLKTQPELIFDVAHNPEAAHLLYANFSSLPQRRTLAVFSMFKDKNITATLKPTATIISEWYIAKLKHQRAASLKTLTNSLAQAYVKSRNVKVFSDIKTAFSEALVHATPKDRIIVFGSFYVVAEVLKSLSLVGYKRR